MIAGSVNALLEAAIRLVVRDVQGSDVIVEVILDTAFTGDITLSATTIASLQLPFLTTRRARLADGTLHPVKVYNAQVVWEGQPRLVEVEEVEGQPLLGTHLLKGCEVHVEFVNAGAVTIQPRNTP